MSMKGNVLFLILIAVALFAALSYAITQSGRGSGSIDKENVVLDAARIIQVVGIAQQVIMRLKTVHGCGDDEISFDNLILPTNYDNSNAPANKSCHFFEPEGGGLSLEQFALHEAWEDPAKPSGASIWMQPYFSFGGMNAIQGAGSANGDLVIMLPYIKASLCDEINRQLDIGSNNRDSNIDLASFIGTYGAVPVGDEGAGSDLAGQMMVCVDETGSSTAGNHFYSVLIAR
ncbi:MAG: hypothetical protein OXT65_01765 [Alphaproteobacteria bacterium]|nr:hypothetical protein [Alphaproteobacteria bacterium]